VVELFARSYLGGGVLAEVFAQVGQGEIDVTVAEAILAGVVSSWALNACI
jgi:hypothetical protein